MRVLRAAQVLQHVDLAVEHLQHEIVEGLQAAARARIGGVARQRLELGVAPADDALQPAVDDRMGMRDQHRRRERLVEDDGLVAHFEHARQSEAVEAGLDRLANLEADARMRDLDLLLEMHAGGGIDDRLDVPGIAAAGVGAGHVDLARIDRRGRHGHPDQLLVGAFRQIDRQRQRARSRHVEGRAVLEDAACPAQREFVLLGEVAVDLDRREAPGIGADAAHPVLDQPLEIAVVLLQMMLSKEQPFGPCNLAVPRH